MILLVGHYAEPNVTRASEYLHCLWRNCKNPHIERIYVFLEDRSPLFVVDPKVKAVPFGARLKFCDVFDYANLYCQDQVCIVANSDIYFDGSLAELRGYDWPGKLLALSRWETTSAGKVEYNGLQWSQDAWIFRSPIVPFPCAFPFGILACDTRLSAEAKAVGLEVLNPCKTVRAIHVHTSAVRNYTLATRLQGKEAWIVPQALHDEPEPEQQPAQPMGFNPYYVIQNKILPLQTLARKR